MSNMSYCQFENTYNDLVDCFDSLNEKEISGLSKSEKEYAISLIKLCEDISNSFINEIEDEDEL